MVYFGRGDYEDNRAYLGYSYYAHVFDRFIYVSPGLYSLGDSIRAIFSIIKNAITPFTFPDGTIAIKTLRPLPLHHRLRLVKLLNGKINEFFLRLFVKKHKRGHVVVECIYPGSVQWKNKLGEDLFGFHLHDDYEAYPAYRLQPEIYYYDQYLSESFDYIHVISRYLKEKVEGWCSRILYQPNGIDFEQFQDVGQNSSLPEDTTKLEQPIIGWIGNNASMDRWPAFESIIRECPGTLLLIGGLSEELKKKISSFSNIVYVGYKPFSEIPAYIRTFDAGIAPYQGEFAKSCSPLKILQYLALGKPVIASKIGEAQSFPPGLLEWVDTYRDFGAAVQKAIEVNDHFREKDRIEFAQKAAWNYRLLEKRLFIENLLKHRCPK